MLADDDDSAGARHPAQTVRRDGDVALFELPEDGGLVHPAMIAMVGPPGKCRAAHSLGLAGPISGVSALLKDLRAYQ